MLLIFSMRQLRREPYVGLQRLQQERNFGFTLEAGADMIRARLLCEPAARISTELSVVE
jgi:hypothetical protein